MSDEINELREIRRKNLEFLCKHHGMRKTIADRYGDEGCDTSYITNMINGAKPITDKGAIKLEKAANKPSKWFDAPHWDGTIDGEIVRKALPTTKRPGDATFVVYGGFEEWDDSTPMHDDEVGLNYFREVEMAAGSGRTQVIENHGAKLRFKKASLREYNVSINDAACAKVSGNSMEPAMFDGTTIGIDKSKTKIVNGDIYAIDHDGQLRIKLIYTMPGGVIRLRSYNRDEWPDEDYSVDDAQKIKIIGRVFWWSVMR